MKFKVGDKVKANNFYAFRGVVVSASTERVYPYEVKGPSHFDGSDLYCLFNEEELSLDADETPEGLPSPQPQTPSVDCTCISLLNGHMPECPYPKRGCAA
jgi:hypothetical protein